MGSRRALVVLTFGALVLPAACRGESEPLGGGTSGSAGKPSAGGAPGSGGANNGHSGASGATSRGGSGTATGAGAGGDTGNAAGKGGGTSTGGTDTTAGRAGSAATGGSASGAAGGAQGGTAGVAGSEENGGDGGNDPGPVDCGSVTARRLSPDANGWIDAQAVCNDVGVQGAWGVYGDMYRDATCLDPGMHEPAECSHVTMPNPDGGFPNIDGHMHTVGTIARILPCPSGLTTSGCPDHDYRNMWGASIGFDFNALPDELGGTRQVWDPDAHGVVGIAFTIDKLPAADMRVEFPMLLTDAEAAADTPPLPPGSSSESHQTGSPYWDAQRNGDRMYPPSPIFEGQNQIRWADIAPPSVAAYTFDRKRLLGIRFRVTASTTATSFEFTISNFTFLRN